MDSPECMKLTRDKELELITVMDRFVEIMHDLYGFYIDVHEGVILYGNKVEIARKSGVPRMLWATKPGTEFDAAFHHTATPQEIVARNRPEGPNIIKIRNYILVMTVEHWNEDIRVKIAEILEFGDSKNVKSDILGDLTKLRNDILHNRGKAKNSVNNKIIPFKKNNPIEISPELLERILINIFKDLNEICLTYTGKKGYQDHSLDPKFKAWHRRLDRDLYIWRGTSMYGVGDLYL